ncbi:MAG: right-handed parallel beta-helix repeat-containing protein [Nitrososphaera sp.]|nr:right-handed parallel beta-helix repeat-containing protein [Nitrososphaera sp.]
MWKGWLIISVFVLLLLELVIFLLPANSRLQALRPSRWLPQAFELVMRLPFFGRFLPVFLLLVSISAQATTYYVDGASLGGACNDANAGTSESAPWCTVKKAMQTLVAGDTARIKAHTYDENGTCDSDDPWLKPSNSGVSGNPITFIAFDSNNRPIIRNTSAICSIIGVGSADGVNYITFDGLDVFGNAGAGGNVRGFNVFDSTGTIIRNSIARNIVHTGTTDNRECIRLEGSTDLLIEENEVFDCRNAGGGSDNGGAIKSYGCTDCIIENNYVHDVGVGIRQKAGTSSRLTVRFNFVEDAADKAFYLGATNSQSNFDNEWYQNIAYRSGEACWHVNGNATSVVTRSKFRNNVCVDSVAPSFDSTGGAFVDLEAFNNIYYQTSGANLGTGGGSWAFCGFEQVFNATSPGAACNSNLLTSDPNFTLSGVFDSPNDVKRTSYPTDGRGGANPNVRGAYITGNECIGLTANCGEQQLQAERSRGFARGLARGIGTLMVMVGIVSLFGLCGIRLGHGSVNATRLCSILGIGI